MTKRTHGWMCLFFNLNDETDLSQYRFDDSGLQKMRLGGSFKPIRPRRHFLESLSWKSSFNRSIAVAQLIAFSFLILIPVNNASASSNWSQPSSYSPESTDNSSSYRSNSRSKKDDSSEVSPFSPGSNNLALDLGQVFLMGGLGSQYADSIGTQLHYTYGVSNLFAFDSSAGYSQHSNGLYSLATVLSGMRLNMAWYDKIVPYLNFGLGFYSPSYRDVTTAPTSGSSSSGISSTTAAASTPTSLSAILFGIHMGPGIDLELNKNLFFGAALTFHQMFGTTQALANGTAFNLGGTYTSFFLHLGVTF